MHPRPRVRLQTVRQDGYELDAGGRSSFEQPTALRGAPLLPRPGKSENRQPKQRACLQSCAATLSFDGSWMVSFACTSLCMPIPPSVSDARDMHSHRCSPTTSTQMLSTQFCGRPARVLLLSPLAKSTTNLQRPKTFNLVLTD